CVLVVDWLSAAVRLCPPFECPHESADIKAPANDHRHGNSARTPGAPPQRHADRLDGVVEAIEPARHPPPKKKTLEQTTFRPNCSMLPARIHFCGSWSWECCPYIRTGEARAPLRPSEESWSNSQ